MAKLIDNGSTFIVKLTQDDVAEWAEEWPCFGTPRALWFEFEKKGGDLVNQSGDTYNVDGSALVAMSQDAACWGRFHLARPRVRAAFCANFGNGEY